MDYCYLLTLQVLVVDSGIAQHERRVRVCVCDP